MTHSFSVKDIRQTRVRTRAGEDNGSESSDGSKTSRNEAELHDVSNNSTDTDASNDGHDTEPKHLDAIDNHQDTSANTTADSTEARIACDKSDNGENSVATGNSLPPNPVMNRLSDASSMGAVEDGTKVMMQGHTATSGYGLLPGASTTGGSDGSNVIQLSDALSWQQTNDRGNYTDSFFHGFSNTSMSTPNGTWGQGNELGVSLGDGNQWTSNQSISFLDSLYDPTPDKSTYGTGAIQYEGPGLLPLHPPPHDGRTTSAPAMETAGNQGQYYHAPDLPMPPLSSDLHEEQSAPTTVERSSSKLPIPDSDPENSDIQIPTASLPTEKVAAKPRVPGERSSRSGRTIIPSTRLEKMNEIGSNAKENIPPITPHQSSEWITSAKVQLLQLDLGEEWKACLKVWLVFEESLDYGAKTKVSDNPSILSAS